MYRPYVIMVVDVLLKVIEKIKQAYASICNYNYVPRAILYTVIIRRFVHPMAHYRLVRISGVP